MLWLIVKSDKVVFERSLVFSQSDEQVLLQVGYFIMSQLHKTFTVSTVITTSLEYS